MLATSSATVESPNNGHIGNWERDPCPLLGGCPYLYNHVYYLKTINESHGVCSLRAIVLYMYRHTILVSQHKHCMDQGIPTPACIDSMKLESKQRIVIHIIMYICIAHRIVDT